MALHVPDDLWAVMEALLQRDRPKPKGGWPRAPDRARWLAAFGVRGSASNLVCATDRHPVERGTDRFGCCGKTCWRRLGEWHAAGVWARLHRVLLERLRDGGALDWIRAALDSASLPAKGGRGGRAEPDGSR